GGAILVGFFAFRIANRRETALFGASLRWPQNRQADKALVIGSLLFGAGWGLAGFCPGPALVSMADGQPKALIFVAAMLAGMLGFELMERFVHAPRRARFNEV
ncbi:MAG: hypothetical protein EBW39_12695, partial [Betaproteobacteria bacterium]|nr:hypothetical protein [Betaproteobacteria bacterium]